MGHFRKILFFVSLSVFGPFSFAQTEAPKAGKILRQTVLHGDTLNDNYFWMRDKTSPEVINHLYAENAYADRHMKGTAFLQKIIYEELKGRRKENYDSRPHLKRGYYYYTRFEKGKNYPMSYRKKDTINAKEQLILDENKLAEGLPYLHVEGRYISPNQKLLYYGFDTKGDHVLEYRLKDIDKDSLYPGDILKNASNLIWAEDNKTVYYTTLEKKSLRSYRVYKHVLGTDPANDILVYEETDNEFSVSLSRSSSRKYIFIRNSQTRSAEAMYMSASGESNSAEVFVPRKKDLLYEIDHFENDEFYVLTNWKAIDFQLMKTTIKNTNPSAWIPVIGPRENVMLEGFSMTKDYLIVEEKEKIQERIIIYDRKNSTSDTIRGDAAFCSLGYSWIDYNYETSNAIEYSYDNMITPETTVDFRIADRRKKIVERDTILGNYDPALYETKRLWAPAPDGKLIPMTIAYKKGIKLDGNNPVYMTGYGAYGSAFPPDFDISYISYMDRGFIVAIAHVRGGNDMGYQWYLDGKMFNKKNSFTDFISCAEYLIKEKYSNKEKIAAQGASAGGLLMAAVSTMRPDLFKSVVANVPFVDVIATMLDESIPLTSLEFDEWGDPMKKDCYQYMRSYSPIDNVKPAAYPNLLVTAGYNDSQVGYFEPAKWVAKMREVKTDTNLLLFKTNMDAGHGGSAARYEAYKETAYDMAFIMKCLGVKEDYITITGKVVDENNSTIPFVNIYIEGTTKGTTSNADGEFSFTLKQGENPTLIFQTLGYKKVSEKIDINSNIEDLTIKMRSENFQLKEVVVKAKSKDPAYAIMREAINRRKSNLEKVNSYSADVYMKGNVNLIEIPKKFPGIFPKNELPDSNNLGLIYLSESVAKYYFKRPDETKEEMIASRVAGRKNGFSWNRVSDAFFNLYDPSINLEYYSERPFISPLAPSAMAFYKFKYQGSFYQNNKTIDKIQVIPRRKGDPLFEGDIYIIENDNYQVYSSDLMLTKNAQIEFVDTVWLKQETVNVNDSLWMPLQMQISSFIKIFGFKATDMSVASMSNYKINIPFPKKFFTNEIFRIENEANKKDSTFWKETRRVILTPDEAGYYGKADSIEKKKDTKEYKDSLNKARNKFSASNILFGYEYRNYKNNTILNFDPITSIASQNTVEGLKLNYNITYRKRDQETRKGFIARAMLGYGFANKILSLGGAGRFTIRPYQSEHITLSAGRTVLQYNNHEPISPAINSIYTLFIGENFMKLYLKDVAKLTYSRELFNGFYFSTSAAYINRTALLNYTTFSLQDEKAIKFTSNNPLNPAIDTAAFAEHQTAQLIVSFRYVPAMKYESRPNHKDIIGSKYPEFYFSYKKGMGTQNADFNYDYLEAGMGKDIDLHFWGEFSFDITGGIFFNTGKMNFIDYRHFNGNQTILLSNKTNTDGPQSRIRDPLTSFNNLPYYSFSTNESYFEAHAEQNFRGFFIGKIPFLRRTKIFEVAGLNMLSTPSFNYTEIYAGADKIFKFFRFNIGTSFSSGKKGEIFYRFGFRLRIL